MRNSFLPTRFPAFFRAAAEISAHTSALILTFLLTLTLTLTFTLTFTLVLMSAGTLAAQNPEPQYDSVKIWDVAKHCAFTDILEFQGKIFCTFRESSFGHIPAKETGVGDGSVRILRSADGGKSWESAALLSKKTYDLRDSKLSITPDGRLMALMGGSVYENQKLMRRRPQASFSDREGMNFSEPQDIFIDEKICSDVDWLWRVTWYQGTGYGVLYQPLADEWKLFLVKTQDGIHYESVTQLAVPGRPNEATVRFTSDGQMYILVRREKAGANTAWFGKSSAPFTDWTWNDTGESLGGPNFFFLPNGKIFAGGRVQGRTGLGFLDEQGKFRLFTLLPSAGDNSYPGFLIQNETLLVSYYSSHEEGKTSIFLAKIPLETLMKE